MKIRNILCVISGLVILFAFSGALSASPSKPQSIVIKKDRKSIEAGRALFRDKCSFCHETASSASIVGPGLKGIMKNRTLPVSGRPSTAENIVHQLKTPFKEMPSFSYMNDRDIGNIIAFLNTL